MKSGPAWLDDSEIFRHRRAKPVERWERWTLGLLLFLGLQSVLLFAWWWFQLEHVGNPVLFALLSFATPGDDVVKIATRSPSRAERAETAVAASQPNALANPGMGVTAAFTRNGARA